VVGESHWSMSEATEADGVGLLLEDGEVVNLLTLLQPFHPEVDGDGDKKAGDGLHQR